MPWPIRSTSLGFYNGTPAANTLVTLGTVPVGKRWLLKEWVAYNAGAATRNVVIAITRGAVTNVVDLSPTILTGTTSGNSTRHLVLNAGDVLKFQTSQAQAIQVTVSGAQLG